MQTGGCPANGRGLRGATCLLGRRPAPRGVPSREEEGAARTRPSGCPLSVLPAVCLSCGSSRRAQGSALDLHEPPLPLMRFEGVGLLRSRAAWRRHPSASPGLLRQLRRAPGVLGRCPQNALRAASPAPLRPGRVHRGLRPALPGRSGPPRPPSLLPPAGVAVPLGQWPPRLRPIPSGHFLLRDLPS